MGKAIMTIKIMPESVEADLNAIKEKALDIIKKSSANDDMKVVQEPIAFGLEALNITFIIDEASVDPEELEKSLSEIASVNSVETTDVRRAVG